MDNKRRDTLRKCMESLQAVSAQIEDVKGKEEEVRDNTPENFQETERYEICEAACDILDEVITLVQDAQDRLEEIDGVTA